LLKSQDRGRTWTSIASNLPDRYVVWCIVEDHKNRNLLFAGTEFGLFFTVDGGLHWVQLKNGAPPIPFRDLAIQRRESDLVAATFGRGFYVLDDYTPLRQLSPGTNSQETALFQPREALLYDDLGYVVAAFGNATMPNPPFGAALSYYLKEGAASDDNGRIVLAITDTQGQLVRRITGPATPGLHRIQWDLRREPPSAGDGQSSPRGRRGGRGRQAGPLVEPGRYTISLIKVVGDKETPLGKSQALQVNRL